MNAKSKSMQSPVEIAMNEGKELVARLMKLDEYAGDSLAAKCDRCGQPANHQITGFKGEWFDTCRVCSDRLDVLFEHLPFTAEDCEPDNDNGLICSIIVTAFYGDEQFFPWFDANAVEVELTNGTYLNMSIEDYFKFAYSYPDVIANAEPAHP